MIVSSLNGEWWDRGYLVLLHPPPDSCDVSTDNTLVDDVEAARSEISLSRERESLGSCAHPIGVYQGL